MLLVLLLFNPTSSSTRLYGWHCWSIGQCVHRLGHVIGDCSWHDCMSCVEIIVGEIIHSSQMSDWVTKGHLKFMRGVHWKKTGEGHTNLNQLNLKYCLFVCLFPSLAKQLGHFSLAAPSVHHVEWTITDITRWRNDECLYKQPAAEKFKGITAVSADIVLLK